MKKISELTLLHMIYQLQPIARRALADKMGLSLNSIGELVSRLVDLGLVTEAVSSVKGPGRPAVLLSVRGSAGKVAGLDIGGGFSRAVICDLDANITTELIIPTQVVPDRSVILDNIEHLIEDLCEKAGISAQTLLGLGIGVRGIVNVRKGEVVDWPNTPAWAKAWAGLNLSSELGRRLGMDLIVVDDTVRAMGMTAYRYGPAKGCANFLYVFIGSGIGSGIFINGWPYLGSSGITGELGHVTIDDQGPLCSCGNRGCLEMTASTTALLRKVRDRLQESRLMSMLREPYEKNSLTLDSLIGAARNRDKLAFQILDEAGTHIGKVLAIYINLLDPEMVVLGGPLAQDGGIILDAVQRQVRLRALQHIAKDAHIVCDEPGEFCGARGAAIMALDKAFSCQSSLNPLLEGKS